MSYYLSNKVSDEGSYRNDLSIEKYNKYLEVFVVLRL